jgi:hypothetical protein
MVPSLVGSHGFVTRGIPVSLHSGTERALLELGNNFLIKCIVTDLTNAWLDDGAINTYFKRMPTIHDRCHATTR